MTRRFIHSAARVLLSLDLFMLGLRALLGFESGVKQLAAAGFPSPELGMGIAMVTAWMAGAGFLQGSKSPLPTVAFLLLCLPTFGVLAALYSGSAWGDLQWLLQLLILAELPLAAGVAAFVLTAEPRPAG